jgi:hypothetical protein
MGISSVYLDFQDTIGWRDISNLVIYNTLKVNQNGFNTSFGCVQSSCSFTISFSSELYSLYIGATKSVLVKVLDENSSPMFYGHFQPTKQRKYNGILSNTQIDIAATDCLDNLEVSVGDVVYTNCKVLNPLDAANSIVHKLALIAGWSSDMVISSVIIPTIIPKFAPPNEDDDIKSVLNKLLYEYGYVLHLDATNKISPVLWQIPASVTPAFVFNDTNILNSVSVLDDVQQYDGVKTTYYEMGSISKVRLYTDDNCTYNEDGTFSGYDIISGYYYPPEVNMTDPTTGENQIVYQEYTDAAIQYKTNYAIVKNLDYNYKAFKSDFSAIIATANHFVDLSFDTGLTVVNETFLNKKAEIVYRNMTPSAIKLYYNDIYGDVWYKSSERISEVSLLQPSINKYTYTMEFVFDTTIAQAFTKALASIYAEGCTSYKFTSEIFQDIGTVGAVTLNDGTSQLIEIQSWSLDDATKIYTYTCRAISANTYDITYQSVASGVVVNTDIFTAETSVQNINVPYVNGVADYSNAFIDMFVYKNGNNVSPSWSFSAEVGSGIVGSFDPTYNNRYNITAINASGGNITISASKINHTTIQKVVSVSSSVSDNVTSYPPDVSNIIAIANEDSIRITPTIIGSESLSDSIAQYVISISKDSGSTWTEFSVSSVPYEYSFNRSVEGYPEKTTGSFNLSLWRIRAKVKNIYGTISQNWGTSASGISVDTSIYKTWEPVSPVVTVIAEEYGLQYSWVCDESSFYGGKTYSLSLGGTVKATGLTMKDYFYPFNRNTDGYPEKVINGGGLDNLSCVVSCWNSAGNHTDSSIAHPDVSSYLTWIPGVPELQVSAAGRKITLMQKQANSVYGFSTFRDQIRREDESSWYKLGLSEDAYTSEVAYKQGVAGGYTETAGTSYDIAVPLRNQAISLPEDTGYYFQAASVVAVPTTANPNAVHVSAYGDDHLGIAKATGVSDVVGSSITEAKLSNGAVSFRTMSAGMSGNLIPNADFSSGLAGWELQPVESSVIGYNLDRSWSIGSGNDEPSSAYIHGVGATLGIWSALWTARYFAVSPGERFEAYAYLGTHRCTGGVVVAWYNRDKAWVATSYVYQSAGDPWGGNTINLYARRGFFANVPDGVYYARLFIQISGNIESDPYVFFTYCFFGRATINQTEFTSWHSGPVSRIRTENMEADNINGDRIQFNTLHGNKIIAKTATLETLNVLAQNKINPNTDAADNNAGWYIDTGTSFETVDGYRTMRVTTSGGVGGGATISSDPFIVLPNDLIKFSFGLDCPNYTSGSGLYIGLTYGQTFKRYVYSFVTKKWSYVDTGSSMYFVMNYVSTSRKNFTTYILGATIDISTVPAPTYTDETYEIYCLQLSLGDTSARIRTGYNTTVAGTYWRFYLPQAYVVGSSKIVAEQIIVEKLTSIKNQLGTIVGDDSANYKLVMSPSSTEIDPEGTFLLGATTDAGYLRRYKSGGLWYLDIKTSRFVVDSVSSKIYGAFQVFPGDNSDCNEGIRIVNATDGYSLVAYGASTSISGWQSGQWWTGKDPSGDFIISGPNLANTAEQNSPYPVKILRGGAMQLCSSLSVVGACLANNIVLNTDEIAISCGGTANLGALFCSSLARATEFQIGVNGAQMRVTSSGAASFAGNMSIGTGVTGPVTYPTRLDLGSNYSIGASKATCKLYLYPYYGFGIGLNSDIQYHSDGKHDFYINDVLKQSITSSYVVTTIPIQAPYIGRWSPSSGCLVGSYNNVGDNDTKSNPIYTIGSAYMPSDTSLGNMLGIGYSHSNFWGVDGITARSGWGQYVCANGVISVLLTENGIWTSGQVYGSSLVVTSPIIQTGNYSSGNGMSIGYNNTGSATAAVSVGFNNAIGGLNDVCIGNACTASGYGVAIGGGARCLSSAGVAIGYTAETDAYLRINIANLLRTFAFASTTRNVDVYLILEDYIGASAGVGVACVGTFGTGNTDGAFYVLYRTDADTLVLRNFNDATVLTLNLYNTAQIGQYLACMIIRG